ncbi:MAG: LLM class flavin-dependent oxidoreductase [Chloroflexi bacterium]|nr:LLM class flavin-dependent oxidoreductase [Chloroflexota bacterium]
MPIEFIGMIATQEASEVVPPQGATVDPEFTARFAQVHEEGGFDRILIGYGSRWPDGWQVANHAVRATRCLKILLAHRPGAVAPSLTARQAVSFDHLTGGGRLALHIITGGDEADQRREGDFLDHDARYRRTDEYLHLLRRLWSAREPFDFAGEFYRLEDAVLPVRAATDAGIPLFFGGASTAALSVGVRHADVFMLWGEPLTQIRERLAAIGAAADQIGRTLRFSLSVRPILAPTEAAAWARADEIAERALVQRGRFLGARGRRDNSSVGSARLLAAAAQADVHDTRLWTKVAAITGAAGNSTALVGTPEQVAEALLAYVDLGVDIVLIRGFHPLQDAIDYGRELIPLVRAEVARRDSRLLHAEQVVA